MRAPPEQAAVAKPPPARSWVDARNFVSFNQSERKTIIAPAFESWDELLDLVEPPPIQSGSSGLRDPTTDNRWYGTRDVMHCLKLAREGWPEGTAHLVKASGELAELLTSGGDAAISRLSESGDEVDMDRFIEGDPENMVEYQMKEYTGGKGGRIVKLLVNITSGCDIRDSSIFLRGAVAMAFVDMLEKNGYRVELWIGEVGIACDRNIFIRALLKPANQSFDIDRIAFALCNPSVQRRLFFRLYEHLPEDLWNVERHVYGSVGVFNDPDPEVIEFGAINNRLKSPAAAKEYLFASLEKFGVKMEMED